MTWLVWNIRGLNKRYKQKEVKKILKTKKIGITAIVETRVKENKFEIISKNIGPGWDRLHNYSAASNGRIWVLWDTIKYQVTKLVEGDQIMHCEVRGLATQIDCMITIIYGFNTIEQRKELWEDLKILAQSITKPWLAIRDFNAIMCSMDRKIEDARNELMTIQSQLQQNYNEIMQELERSALQKLEKWSMVKESIMKQKVRAKWIQLGDANTKHFSAIMKKRNHKKQIKELTTLEGWKINQPREIKEEAIRFYKILMGTTARSLPAINRMVTKAVREFFSTGRLYRAINCTAITLIPKTANPTIIKEYMPITCCTVLYKLISKILAARLQKVIDGIICEAHAGFIPGRKIGDNIIMAHELINGYTRKHVTPRCMIKIDLQKAYDSVEWSYLE
ncbi:uncharacterized protein LOC142180704 [Nicotiana tabacum]|uniref:Uncharacterized protein LOC142180704 n=1 Tax=Nicotiana tabacum TaxID=4097 RepID=A0AC58UH99_TOBAC